VALSYVVDTSVLKRLGQHEVRRREPFVDDAARDRRAGRYARHRLTINRGSPPRSSTERGTPRSAARLV
jgi:hypothetical protein